MSGPEEYKREHPKQPKPGQETSDQSVVEAHNKQESPHMTEQTAAETQKHSETMREPLNRVAESMQGVSNSFSRRLEKNLYPLLSKEDVAQISVGSNALNARSLVTPKDFQEAAEALRQMSSGLEKFGTYKSSVLAEDSESLRGIGALAQQAETNVHDLTKALSHKEGQDSALVVQAAVRLATTLEAIRARTLRAAGRLDEYTRGR